ncbi:MAG: hypothetical protein LBP28_01105, partial [Coriobacteriales bacterium]|nr:hypothetical protein [Coriobacteriales bacterium]
MRITVAGAGYVGFANAVMLAQRHEVRVFDIDELRVATINAGGTPIADADIEALLKADQRLATPTLNLRASSDAAWAFADASLVLIATPTDYDPQSNRFDTTSVEAVVAQARHHAPSATIVIRSTLPIGYSAQVAAECRAATGAVVLHAPEFLREGSALDDSRHPSRLVIGADLGDERALVVAREVGELLLAAAAPPVAAPAPATAPAAAAPPAPAPAAATLETAAPPAPAPAAPAPATAPA